MEALIKVVRIVAAKLIKEPIGVANVSPPLTVFHFYTKGDGKKELDKN